MRKGGEYTGGIHRFNRGNVIASAAMLRRLPGALAITLTFAVYGCSKKKEPQPASDQTVLAAVPAPKGLVAELAFPRPGETWASVRAAIGGPAAMLPGSFGLLATTVFDLPPTAGELFDANIPALGAVIEDEGRFAVVLAFHVKDGPKIAEIASTGENARFTKNADKASGVLLLDAKEEDSGPALGISGNYLTIASRSSDLTRFAPFVTRTLPTRPVPKEDVVALAPSAGLAHIVKLAKAEWEGWKAESAGLEAMMMAQLGDDARPNTELGFLNKQAERALEVLDDLDEARLSLAIAGSAVHLRLGAKARSGEGAASKSIASMAPGDAKPLLELPAASVLAVLYRDTAETRAESVAEQLESFEAGDEKLNPAEKARLEEGLRAWAKGRGDWMSFGVLHASGTTSAIVRGAVADSAMLDGAITDNLSRFTQVPAFAKSLEAIIGPFKLTTPSAKGATKSARLTRREGGANSAMMLASESFPKELDLVWSVGDDLLSAAVGKDAKSLFTKSLSPTFAGDAEIAKMVGALDGDVSFALLAQPRKLVAEVTGKVAPEEAPVLVSFGRSGAREAWLRIDASQFALRDLAMLAGGM